MNISKLFLTAAKQYPDHLAIIDSKESIRYADLEREVQETAAYFKEKGIGLGDRVLVFVPMGIDLYRIVLALFYIGATAVFLDEWVSKKRLALCCQIAECKGFVGVFKATLYSFFSKELRQIPVKLKLKKMLSADLSIAEVEPNTPALITFTTGSTGTPKAANRSHGFLKHQFEALMDKIEPQANDVDMPALPIVLFVNLGVGCTSVIADFKMTKPNLLDPAVIAKQIKLHKVNRITASPFFIKKLSEYGIENPHIFQDIEKIFTGGAPVFPSEAALYLKAFPKAQSMIVYGSTEAEPISSISAQTLINTPPALPNGLPVGQAYHKTNLKIIAFSEKAFPSISPQELDSMSLENGKIGEIIVSGPHVLKQYFKNAEAIRTNKIIVNELMWHRTGDSGMLIENELFLTGRCSQLIKNQQGYLSPFIIENQLQNITGINFGTLLSFQDQHVLVVESPLNLQQLETLLVDIPHHKIVILNKIPRDPRHNSKIDYAQLKIILAKE